MVIRGLFFPPEVAVIVRRLLLRVLSSHRTSFPARSIYNLPSSLSLSPFPSLFLPLQAVSRLRNPLRGNLDKRARAPKGNEEEKGLPSLQPLLLGSVVGLLLARLLSVLLSLRER